MTRIAPVSAAHAEVDVSLIVKFPHTRPVHGWFESMTVAVPTELVFGGAGVSWPLFPTKTVKECSIAVPPLIAAPSFV